MMIIDAEKPLWQLSVGEFMELLNSVSQQPREEQTPDDSYTYEYGIAGIMKIFNCSDSSAKRIKASGTIDEAISQQGRLIVVNKEKALSLFGKNKIKQTKTKRNNEEV